MRKLLVLFLCAILSLSIFAGCARTQGNNTATTQSSSKANQEAIKQESTNMVNASTGSGGLTLPIVSKPITLTVWAGLSSRAAASIKNYSEMLAFQELEKRTGIHLKFLHPPVGQEKEQFNLMLASGDLADLIYYTWATDYSGGPEKAINDGVIIQLNDLIEKYSPNFSSILKDNPQVRIDSMTDSGKFYMYPLLRLSPRSRVSGGFQIRKDWLDKLGLKVPTNIDEWHTVLTAFKQRDPNGNGKADEIPFISSNIAGVNGVQRFTCAWGIGYDYYWDGKTVKYGPAQPEYKEFLQTMRQWYKEGLIDPDFLTSDMKAHDAKVTSGIAGSYYGLLNSYMGTYTGIMQKKDPTFQLIETPIPIAPDGKQYNFHADAARAVATEGFAISSQNKYPVESAKLLDYFYSEDGRVLMNLGIEGVTFTMVNGHPKYTDLITKNPDGLSLDRAAAKYMPVGTSCRLFQDDRYWDQMMTYDNQRQAIDILLKATLERVLPPITPTPDESSQLSAIQNEINTYVSEMFAKFIMGQEDISNFDNYIETLKSMKLDDALAIQQKALERYLNRK